MNQPKQTRRLSAEKVRNALNHIADEICAMQDRVVVSLCGNTFEIHLDGASIDITINENTKGGER